ncbi:hypothetical protein QBC37DRAFT_406301 [Rhypophila decipiens]|uniref:Uncharacterized protein n=1 Tax=Rhypophila decipiens TaxID=261697 RepID=A0AAN7B1E5_9PEZI|nr:hypothetical protein QBC37DRAFT_406301 [Rhypophila decipiens]
MEASREDAAPEVGHIFSAARQAAESILEKYHNAEISTLRERAQKIAEECRNLQIHQAKGEKLREELKMHEEAVQELKDKIASHDEVTLDHPALINDATARLLELNNLIEIKTRKHNRALQEARNIPSPESFRHLLFRDETPANFPPHQIPPRRGAQPTPFSALPPLAPLAPLPPLPPLTPLPPPAPPQPEAVDESDQPKTSVESPSPSEPTPQQQQQQPPPTNGSLSRPRPSSPLNTPRRTRNSVKRSREKDDYEPPASSSKRHTGAARPAHSSTGSEDSELVISYKEVSKYAGKGMRCSRDGQGGGKEKETRGPEPGEENDEVDPLVDDHVVETDAETGSSFRPDGGDEDEDPEDFRSDHQLVEEEEVRYLQRSLQAPTARRCTVQPNGFDQNPSTPPTRPASATGLEPGKLDLPAYDREIELDNSEYLREQGIAQHWREQLQKSPSPGTSESSHSPQPNTHDRRTQQTTGNDPYQFDPSPPPRSPSKPKYKMKRTGTKTRPSFGHSTSQFAPVNHGSMAPRPPHREESADHLNRPPEPQPLRRSPSPIRGDIPPRGDRNGDKDRARSATMPAARYMFAPPALILIAGVPIRRLEEKHEALGRRKISIPKPGSWLQRSPKGMKRVRLMYALLGSLFFISHVAV